MAFRAFNRVVSGTRPGVGEYVRGVHVPGVASDITINVSVQPATEDELALLPEGRREDGAYVLTSKDVLLLGDVFDIYGESHEVVRRQVWQNGILSHYAGTAVRVKS